MEPSHFTKIREFHIEIGIKVLLSVEILYIPVSVTNIDDRILDMHFFNLEQQWREFYKMEKEISIGNLKIHESGFTLASYLLKAKYSFRILKCFKRYENERKETIFWR